MSKPNLTLIVFIFMLFQSLNVSAKYAAIVIDADSGHVIHENEAAQRWYPASLTKVMTMYLTFMALESGQLGLHDVLTVSEHAAKQPMSKLGLHHGQTISVEQAIMAVTTRSANDAAVLLAETVGGSESHFAEMMTQQARHLGMYSSSFQNASGLPDEGQISSARDLAILSAALIRDFPKHYHYFSATEFAYKGRVLPNTNRILKTYPDADGMKTGFTCGSGYNLIASAKRNGHRLIGVLLGAHSSGERFTQMGDLLDLGFEKYNSSGMHVSQLKDESNSPPPFQLSSNRCAGSALQMGADTGGSPQHTAIHIKPIDNANQAEISPIRHRHLHHAALISQSHKIGKHTHTRQHNHSATAKKSSTHVVIKSKHSAANHKPSSKSPPPKAKPVCKHVQHKNGSCNKH